MLDYTLEEVLDFINTEIEDAYTEASKEEADIMADLGKRLRGIRKGFERNKKDESIDPKLTEPKGDEATRRKKDIRKWYSSYVPQSKKEPGDKYYDHPGMLFKSTIGGKSPYKKKYKEIEQKETDLQNKLRDKARAFRSKEGLEYEIYYGDRNNKDKMAKEFIRDTRAAGKHPITYDAYKKHAHASSDPKYKESEQRERDAINKLVVSNRLAKKAEKGFKNKDVETKWKKFADKYEETVYDILEAYEYDIISYEDANDYLDMLALFED